MPDVRPTRYRFTLVSDSSSLLYLDGRLIVNNTGAHSSLMRAFSLS